MVTNLETLCIKIKGQFKYDKTIINKIKKKTLCSGLLLGFMKLEFIFLIKADLILYKMGHFQ